MKISIIGTRGIPANYGGFETFAEEVSKNIIKLDENVQVIVIGDKEQKEKNNALAKLDNINIIYSRYSKNVNPLMFYLDSILMSLKSDIILSCGLAGGYFSWIPKFSKAHFLTNPDGLEWKRAKWSPLKRWLLKSMEISSVKMSDYLICDSKGITQYIQEEYHYKKNLFTIEYGAYINEFIDVNNATTNKVLEQYGLKKLAYHLVVSRLEPENNVHIIIDGYNKSNSKLPLVIVGNMNDGEYVKSLKKYESTNIIFLGGIYDKNELSIIRAKAFTYLHGHSVGGTNPSLLEAMGSKNLCLCHDNIFNRETTRDSGFYFKNEQELKDIFEYVEKNENINNINKIKNDAYNLILEYYNWENIANKYLQAFNEIMGKK